MKKIFALMTLSVMTSVTWAPLSRAADVQASARHGREFWRSIVKNEYAVPPEQQIFPLVRELSGYLSSADPELRDGLAYSILAAWIAEKNQLSPAEMIALLNEWQANLLLGIGESGTDSIFKRSFSALCLELLADRDLKTPFLGKDRYRTLLGNALAYLKEEHDLRAYDPVKGWMHATAHTADLLAVLAENPLLEPDDQGRLLNAISERLSSAHEIFAYGEQDRLASVATAIAVRKDFDASGFRRWLGSFDETVQVVIKESPTPRPEVLKRLWNQNYMLLGLAVKLSMEPGSSAATNAQNAVIELLRKRGF